ncbi:MAG TPA: type VI secretion system tip protein TssI/VgrG [Pyrinomonadaceae bacterium]|jgi:type VI secretion system secreted protein VgrG|nr:type VI secretion system tip protein TssI/VgrG [Pyrinomonadaceae bacterium]
MSTYTQLDRPIQIVTPLGEDVLLLEGFQGRESVSQPFRFELSLLSEQRQLDLDAAVGMRATIKLMGGDGEVQRYINGCVVSFSQGGSVQNLFRYRAALVPWLWLLSYSGGCRIFQHKTVPEIVSQIFTERGFAGEFALRLGGSYEPREYCVQYRETDLSFVSRLLEEEGICYFFEHTADKHTLVLADQSGKFVPCPNQPVARYHTAADDHLDEDTIATWSVAYQVRTGTYTARDFNFEQPRFDLLTSIRGGDRRGFEQYDYPGEYLNTSLGERLVRVRIEEQDATRQAATGSGDCRAFAAGYRFELADHYRPDANRAYVLLSVTHAAHLPANYESDAGGAGANYQNEFVCIPFTATPYRPPRTAPVPVVQGTQTATVVGPAGEEIYTDKYGRIKVQFHWDREGRYDENSSCWVRVSQPWAGGGWGAVSIPRIGQEVVVDFLEGDPDKPIVVGRVYNAAQMPPYSLPAGADMMGFKSNTTKGGGGYNEIVICDGKAGELIRIHAQKDMDTTVRNNDTQHVMVDRTIHVDGRRTQTVKGDMTTTVTEGNQANTVKAGDQTTTVKGNQTNTVQSGNRVNTVEAGFQHNTVQGEIVIESKGDKVLIRAASEIHIVCGDSSLRMDSGGNITLEGINVTVVGTNVIDLNP